LVVLTGRAHAYAKRICVATPLPNTTVRKINLFSSPDGVVVVWVVVRWREGLARKASAQPRQPCSGGRPIVHLQWARAPAPPAPSLSCCQQAHCVVRSALSTLAASALACLLCDASSHYTTSTRTFPAHSDTKAKHVHDDTRRNTHRHNTHTSTALHRSIHVRLAFSTAGANRPHHHLLSLYTPAYR
jgi:hypothetical protein